MLKFGIRQAGGCGRRPKKRETHYQTQHPVPKKRLKAREIPPRPPGGARRHPRGARRPPDTRGGPRNPEAKKASSASRTSRHTSPGRLGRPGAVPERPGAWGRPAGVPGASGLRWRGVFGGVRGRPAAYRASHGRRGGVRGRPGGVPGASRGVRGRPGASWGVAGCHGRAPGHLSQGHPGTPPRPRDGTPQKTGHHFSAISGQRLRSRNPHLLGFLGTVVHFDRNAFAARSCFSSISTCGKRPWDRIQ